MHAVENPPVWVPLAMDRKMIGHLLLEIRDLSGDSVVINEKLESNMWDEDDLLRGPQPTTQELPVSCLAGTESPAQVCLHVCPHVRISRISLEKVQ